MPDTPSVLFYNGNASLLKTKNVGFTGSRKVSDFGIRVTDNSTRQLSAEKVTIVNGYSREIDITAHKAALQTDGNTIFVIAEGILKNRIKEKIKELKLLNYPQL